MKMIKKKTFLNNLKTFVGGSILAQLIPIMILPLLSRLYTPKEFGVYALTIAIAAIITVFFTGKYERALIIANNDKEVQILIKATYLLIFAAFIIFSFISLGIQDNVQEKYLFLGLPIGLLLALNELLVYKLTLNQMYSAITKSKLISNISMVIFQVVFAFIIPGLPGLIIGYSLGLLIQVILLRVLDIEGRKIDVTFKEILEIYYKFKKFPLINASHSLIDVFNQQGILLIFNKFFSTNLVGQFSFMNRILRAPISIIGSSVGFVVYQEISNRIRENKPFMKIIYTILTIVTSIGIILLITINLRGIEIFTFLFGEEWKNAGEQAEILIFLIVINFILSPLTQIPTILNRQGTFAILSFINNVCFITPFIIYANLMKFEEILKISVFITSMFYICTLSWILVITHKKALERK